jgi:hypothetical protein
MLIQWLRRLLRLEPEPVIEDQVKLDHTSSNSTLSAPKQLDIQVPVTTVQDLVVKGTLTVADKPKKKSTKKRK